MPAVHQFGIIKDYPAIEKYLIQNSYIEYDPQKYNCIEVEDDIMIDIINVLTIDTTLGSNYNKPYRGLAWTGITIIPPNSMNEFKEVILQSKHINNIQIIQLIKLIEEAYRQNKHILHFGI